MKRLATLTMVLVAAMAAPVAAQVSFGPQLNWSDDFDLGIGGRVQAPLTQFMTPAEGSPMNTMFVIGSFDWFFPGDEVDGVDVTYIEINANAAYPLVVENFRPYVGGGLNVARVGVDFENEAFEDSSETEIGLNLLGGLSFVLGGFDTFAEARLELGGGEQLVLTFGALFGGS